MTIKNVLHNAVQAMGGAGTLTAESPVDDGARFVITLPQTRPARF